MFRIIGLLLLVVAAYGADPQLGLGPAPVTSATPSGSAGGDLTGTYPNPTVAGISAGTAPIVTTSTLAIGSSAQFTVSAAGATVAPSIATPIISTVANLTLTDTTNTWNPFVYTAGATTAGVITLAGTKDATNSTTAAVVLSGGEAVAKSLFVGLGETVGSSVVAGSRLISSASAITYNGTSGNISIFRSGGTITPNAGDLVLQSDAVGTRGIYFADGTTTALVGQIGGVNPSANTFAGTLIVGRNNATADTAGFVGETLTGTASAVALGGTTTVGNLTSIALTAGKWDVTGWGVFDEGATGFTSGSAVNLSISTANNTDGTEGTTMTQQSVTSLLASGKIGMSIPRVILNLSAGATYYLNERATFAAGSPTFSGQIVAVRLP